ncbi:MAG TPA: hypothetical protein VNR89_08190 [Roseomonas sp.]|nr:hypothetical protein [Roseomonas sp.]
MRPVRPRARRSAAAETIGEASRFRLGIRGGVVLNIMKEELPEERKSRFCAFLLGALAAGALLLTLA